MVACWGDGQVLLFELDGDGGIAGRFATVHSRDTYAAGWPSRAHASLMLADGRVMTTDLGHDLLRVCNVRAGHGLVLDHEVLLAHERSGDIGSFPLDPASGLPGGSAGRLEVASPTALIAAQ